MNSELKERIHKYGFVTQDIYTWEDIAIRIFICIILIPFIPLIIIALFLLSIFSGDVSSFSFSGSQSIGGLAILLYITSLLTILGIGYYFVRIFGAYLVAGRFYYTGSHDIIAGKIYGEVTYENISDALKKLHFLPLSSAISEEDRLSIRQIIVKIFELYKSLWRKTWKKDFQIGKFFKNIFITLFPIGCIVSWKVLLFVEIELLETTGYLKALYGTGWIIFGMLITAILFSIVYRIFHPLYAFGNLGKKIQSLTPKIEQKSQEIQKNFSQDSTNFHILHEGFDYLSSTLSEIVILVIKLEHVEKRANKGNLFDSEKYIDSLRSDIVGPLKSLRSFLEEQREKLLSSQKELQRVRVGGNMDPSLHSGGREQVELSSKRSESLLGELTENIGKLDEMIGKMG